MSLKIRDLLVLSCIGLVVTLLGLKSAYSQSVPVQKVQSSQIFSQQPKRLISYDSAEIVEKGDWIQFDPTEKPKEPTIIKWQQDLGNREEPYIALAYSVKDKEAGGSLFIQKALADSFFKKCQKDEDSSPLVSGGYKIQVDEDFQYGQNNEKTLRFLVYHNKANKPYQHRFIETTAFSNIGNKIIAVGGAAAPPWAAILQKGADLLKGFIGDYLRDF